MSELPEIRSYAEGTAVRVRAAVLDLDGTCLDETQQLHPRVRDAVSAAAAHVPVIIATGRMYISALPWARLLGAREPLVCYEGAVIRALPDDGSTTGAVIREVALGSAAAIRALHVARAHGWHYQVYVDEQILCESMRPEAEHYARVSGVPVTVVGDLESRLSRGTPKAVCVILDPTEIDSCMSTLRAQLDGSARVTQSRTEYVEVVDAQVNKAAACAFVCERLGIAMSEVVAVGDAPNDIELLEAAGVAVAVVDAHPEVLAYADAVCAGPSHGGVADVLEALRLL